MACTFSSRKSYRVWVKDERAQEARTMVERKGSPKVRKGERRRVEERADLCAKKCQRLLVR